MRADMPGFPQTARGNAEPIAVQFSVFLASRVGQFRERLEILATHALTQHGVVLLKSEDLADPR